ncbi:MAG TPA: glycosyltransferase [Casimicrobiaceae bacterium]|jgi:hypothetical protein
MSLQAPQVSVIVRSMGRPSLDVALASIAAQRDVAAEAVVVAACGPGHPPVPQRCGDHPLRLVTSERRLTRPQAANAGLDAARGAWIIFLDDDDVFEPGHLAALLAGAAEAPSAGVITSHATCAFRDGRVERFGQPFSLTQLYERNFIQLSMALFARSHVAAGCRFDESFEILQDWDFLLQLAQRTAFHSVPDATFRWNVDVGESGAGGGSNHQPEKLAQFRSRVYAKWSDAREALIARTTPLLERAAALAASGRYADADRACDAVLSISANDPWALNLRAMLLRAQGRVDDARRVQALAVAVRPDDGALLYNLALLDRAANDVEAARQHARRSATLDPSLASARALAAELG